ncbi:hypothetical protein GALMADRAFT_105185 [Galerina marginata CBS 339.88]|uniref:D-lactate dehydratase n=1 Tax=Galerina marginata (strain CBS 339.88) TaxID=685588 RepID=A0A067SMX1_GALM3|nr:hypothetical protein GALMADRAFT_105185 [Galerina marginata CBS 339.88]
MPSVLIVLTSADKTLTGAQTGWFLPEAAHPYYILAPHASIDFAAPKGPNPPLAEESVQMYSEDEESVRFLNDEAVKAKLAGAKKLSDIDFTDYDAIFYVGGHGPVIDLPTDPVSIKLIQQFWDSGKIVSAVCHGSAGLTGFCSALTSAVDAAGKSIFIGRTATGFSNAEEEDLNTVKDIPFLLEDRIIQLGGTYVKADKIWEEKIVVDGNLITGQNPASAAGVGKAILKALIDRN